MNVLYCSTLKEGSHRGGVMIVIVFEDGSFLRMPIDVAKKLRDHPKLRGNHGR
jgi:hypothetical protein